MTTEELPESDDCAAAETDMSMQCTRELPYTGRREKEQQQQPMLKNLNSIEDISKLHSLKNRQIPNPSYRTF